MPFVDLERDRALAMTFDGRRHGLTQTARIAAAILDISAFNWPISRGHNKLHSKTLRLGERMLRGRSLRIALAKAMHAATTHDAAGTSFGG